MLDRLRPHVSPVDIADKRPAIRTAVDPDPHASIGLQYAKRVQAEYHDRREAILDTQAGALIGLIPLAGYIGYEAARSGTGAHVAALASAGLAGLLLTQVLVQASRIKVYTQAHHAVGCGIGVCRLAAARQGFAPGVESTWRGEIAATRTGLEHVQHDLRGVASTIDAELAQMPQADELRLRLNRAHVEHDRAEAAHATAAAAAAPANPGDGIPPEAGSVPRPGPAASVEHARKALTRADDEIRRAKDALRRRDHLERGKLRVGSCLVSASSLDAAAVRVNALLDVAPSSVLDAELINHVERVMRDADAELDNTIPPMSAAAPFAAVLQNQPVPARVPIAKVGLVDDAGGESRGFVSTAGAEVDRARGTLEDVSRTLTRVQEEILAALAVRAAQGGARTLDLASCRRADRRRQRAGRGCIHAAEPAVAPSRPCARCVVSEARTRP